MSNRRTAVLAALFVTLLAYFVVFEGISLEPEAPEWERGERILSCGAGGIDEIQVTTSRGALTAGRAGEGWAVMPDPGEAAPRAAQSVGDLVDSLCKLPIIDTISDVDSLEPFGLEAPAVEIRVRRGEATQVLQIGSATPASNLLYARRLDREGVLKVGAQLGSEVDKLRPFLAAGTGS